MPRRARLTLSYDGGPFHGFAEQDGVDTVMGTLRDAIGTVVGAPVDLVGAGRTDRGVHAWGQVVSGDLPDDTDLGALRHRVNRMCTPRIVVRKAEWAADAEFSARFSAAWRQYRYRVLNDADPNPFLVRTTWHVREPLDLAAMRLACDPLIGEHDFASFCRRPRAAVDQPPPSLQRRVLDARWSRVADEQTDGLLMFEIRANAFCHQMVRSIVGTIVDVGRRRITAADVRTILLARSRHTAGTVAPPHGLCLWEVGYPPEWEPEVTTRPPPDVGL